MPLQLAPASIIDIARDVMDLLGPQADKANINFSLTVGDSIPKTLTLDGFRVRQILLNLVGNAVKFTTAGRIDIALTYDTSTARLTCTVADTGLGIAEDQLQHLFQRFSQIHGPITRPQGGTGLGLAICKGLVDMMGGAIGVESVAGEGSTFWFEIPAAPATLLAPSTSNDVGGHLDGVRVLVVDDQDGTRELVIALLTPFGAELFEASNGQEAVDMATNIPFDVILMDLRMPVLDGIGAVAAIRSGDGPNSTIPIVAFSANVGSEALRDLDALGFDGQIAKPLSPQQLISTLTSLVFDDQSPSAPLSATSASAGSGSGLGVSEALSA
jgi:CheY-like chemotaxis protein